MSQSDRNDGGPAFPRPATPAIHEDIGAGSLYRSADHGAQGMSLRDWFAGQAIGALISETSLKRLVEGEHVTSLASNAYAIADALLKARSDTPDRT